MGRAELLYRRALGINDASHGSHHPAVAISLRNLAGLLHSTIDLWRRSRGISDIEICKQLILEGRVRCLSRRLFRPIIDARVDLKAARRKS